jgi:hypothetical protein
VVVVVAEHDVVVEVTSERVSGPGSCSVVVVVLVVGDGQDVATVYSVKCLTVAVRLPSPVDFVGTVIHLPLMKTMKVAGTCSRMWNDNVTG